MNKNSAAAHVPAEVEDVQGDGRWMSQHNRFIAEDRDKEPEVLFIGDSLIQQMAFSPIWKSMIEPLHPLNFGVGADQTQHVLWRVTNGELDHIKPKVIVLLVGTNNHSHTAEEVVKGILEIVKVIGDKQPEAQLIVMGIPPRGEKPNELRTKIAAINSSLDEKLKKLENVTFFNIDPSLFLNQEGKILATYMYDYLHFTASGYKKICEPLAEAIQSLLKTFIKVESTSVDTDSIAGELASDG